jgi:hypothetical protein
MEKEFVPYEQVSSLIALGFNEPVIAHRQNGLDICLLKEPKVLLTDLSMILYQQAFRWFREKHNLFGKVYITNFGGDEYSFNIYDLYEEEYKYENFIGASMSYAGTFEAYEEAELACLEKLIEIVKQKIED